MSSWVIGDGDEQILNITRDSGTTDDCGPKLECWRLNDTGRQIQHVEIITQELPAPTTAGLARLPNPRPEVPPVADAAEVFAACIREKEVGATVSALCPPHESPANRGKRRQVRVVPYGNQQVCIFRVALGGWQRTNQSDPADAADVTRTIYESPDFPKQ